MAVARRGPLHKEETMTHETAVEALQALYDRDFALWATEQAQALKERRATALDWDNLAEEVEALARNDKRAIRSYLKNALLHMLKLAYWEVERERNESQWREHFINARNGIAEIVEDSPSLKNYPVEVFAGAYSAALKSAASLIGRRDLPETCPWTLDQVLDESFWPEPAKDETPASSS